MRCGGLPQGLLDLDAQVSTEVVDRTGRPLYETLSARGSRSRALDPERLPDALVRATLAAEDGRFHHHPGIDPLAIARAAWHDARAGRLVEGGSTITQQVVKILTARRRTAAGKAREVLLALRLEHRLTKREILALYLSVAPYGNQLTGAEAASRAYFGCPAENLTPAQAALLASLPQRPTTLNPYRNLERARKRQIWVLGRMRELGLLSEEELRAARAERLQIRRPEAVFQAPHFVERVLAAVGDPPARRIETTLDASLQREVEGIVAMHRRRLLEHGAHNVAVAVLDNATGEWRAWEGSGDYVDAEHGGAIDGVVTPRQPGSALKPFTYALAFERGFTPASVLPDVPAHFPTAEDGVLYSPRNYDGVFRGPLRARLALAGSENVPAVWLLSRTGVPDLLRLLRRVGFGTLDKTPAHYGYALTMGDAEVRLDEMVAAYAVIARGGVWRAPVMVRRVVRDTGEEGGPAPRRGRSAAEAPADAERLLDERAAWWVADILSDAGARAYAFGTGGSLSFPFPVAAKTGTSQAYHDNWTVGFTRDVTVGVWVGNFDRSPLQNSSGVTGAAPIFHDVLLAAQARAGGRTRGPEAGVSRPPRLAARSICALSGRAAGRWCPRVETEWLPADATLAPCLWHRRLGARTVVAWPAVYRAWARTRGLLDPAAPPSAPAQPWVREASQITGGTRGERGVGADGRSPKGAPSGLRIVNPPPGAVYLRDPTLRDEFQTLSLRALAEGGSGRLSWQVDGRPLGTSAADAALDWPLAPGAHTIAVVDGRGRRDEATIRVR